MPATTRSANKQATLEDVGAGSKTATTSGKRKAGTVKSPPSKKPKANPAKQASKIDEKKQPKVEDNQPEDESDVITINRAPVLELWASCVTQFLRPSISWQTCLSAGGAISTITAVAKGRAIGQMEKPDPGEAQAKREKRKEQADEKNLKELDVMSFKLRLDKDGQALVGDKPKKAGEDGLRKKYGGDEQYKRVKETFESALAAWKGKEDDLNGKAFHMYEDFRPNVAPGQKGWGRKGGLRLETIKEVVGGG